MISTIDVNTGKLLTDVKAVLGGSANVHCTKDYMYINEYIKGEDCGEPERNVNSAIKMNLKNGKCTYASREEVKNIQINLLMLARIHIQAFCIT